MTWVLAYCGLAVIAFFGTASLLMYEKGQKNRPTRSVAECRRVMVIGTVFWPLLLASVVAAMFSVFWKAATRDD